MSCHFSAADATHYRTLTSQNIPFSGLLVRAIGYSLILIFLIGCFGAVMNYLNPDENMYIAAGVLTGQGQKLYRDFAFLQMPYLPLVYGAIYRLTGTSMYLLTGKLVSYCFLLMAVFLVHRISKQISDNEVFSIGVTLLFLLNHTVLRSAMESCNYIAPVMLSLLAFHLFLGSSSRNRIDSARIALVGLAVAFATGTKLYYGVVVLPFAAVLLASPPSVSVKERIRFGFLPFVLGVLFGLLPVLYYVDDFDHFYFNNVGYHLLNTQWRELTGFARAMNLYSKIQFLQTIYLRADNLILVLISLVGGAYLWSARMVSVASIRTAPPGALLAMMLLSASILTTLIPTPLWEHYSTMPLSFLFLVFVYSSKTLFRESLLFRYLFLTGVVLALAYNGPSRVLHAYRVLSSGNRAEWAALKVHDVAIGIQEATKEHGARPRVATLFPLYPLEAGFRIYPELATGAFAYRVGELIEDDQRRKFVTVAPENIQDLFQKDVPDAILIGFESPKHYRDLESPLEAFAQAGDYEKIRGDFDGATLYVHKGTLHQ
jgi:hypothetical protein